MGGLHVAPSGEKVDVLPDAALVDAGPLVEVVVSVPVSVAKALTSIGLPTPAPLRGYALIDTGAFCTAVDNSAADALGLPVVDVTSVHSATQADAPANFYPIHFSTVGFQLELEITKALGVELKAQGLIMLIGRDLLQRCLLVYNGQTGAFSLSV
jgi:predicted aspartyl protease